MSDEFEIRDESVSVVKDVVARQESDARRRTGVFEEREEKKEGPGALLIEHVLVLPPSSSALGSYNPVPTQSPHIQPLICRTR